MDGVAAVPDHHHRADNEGGGDTAGAGKYWAVIGWHSEYWADIGWYSEYWAVIGWYSEYWVLISLYSK